MEGPRFEFLPVALLAARQDDRKLHPFGHANTCDWCPDCCSLKRLSEIFGLTIGQLERVRRSGLTEREADMCAVKLGMLPDAIWPDYSQRCLDSERVTDEPVPA